MAEKDSTLVLEVDLGCPRCRKNIKKILCKFEEIRDQMYDETQNTVTITGHFCPHTLKKKLCCKAGDLITCIQIKEPLKENKPPKVDPPPKKDEKDEPKKKVETTKKEEPPKDPKPPAILIGVCCIHCREGHVGGPCYPPQCCQGLQRPPPCYCDYGRPPCHCGCGQSKGYASSCKFYIEEDPASCVIM